MASRKILVLGSGMVARPCVEYLLRNARNEITIACRTLLAAQSVGQNLPRMRAISLDVSRPEQLDPEVTEHDLVISLVPCSYHPTLIKSAIRGKTNVVTTSYVSPSMRELEVEVKKAGIVVLNEVGVDPGVDHLNAIKIIEGVHSKGGKVKEFYSFCGGLPAPECAGNPLRFKFSWSPRVALLSQRNSASFWWEGKQVDIPAKDLMLHAKPHSVKEGYSFVAYPNRDSKPFREFYGIPEAETVVRGSLRYQGNPAFVKALMDLGWLDPEPKAGLTGTLTWAQLFQRAINADNPSEEKLISRIREICKFTNEAEGTGVIDGLRWMGLFSNGLAQVRANNLLDTLSGQLEKLCSFQPGERDLIMLQHKFVVEWRDGKKNTITSTLELFGEPNGYSAMAKSVGMTCGIAAQLLLDGHWAISRPGIWAPYEKAMCDPIRELVEKEGIKMEEQVL